MRRLGIVLALLWPSPCAAGAVDRWSAHIAEASLRFGIPEAWIRRVMAVESGGEPFVDGHPVISRAGAMGLMQLMPETWREIRHALALNPDPHDPHDNILAGAFYLRAMYDRFGYPGLFGAYNAGPGRYAAYLAGARPLPAETRNYVLRVAGLSAARPWKTAAPPPVFIDRGTPGPRTAVAAPFRPRSDSLFVRLAYARGH